nr:glycosyltransferase family 4 protein [Achromobacter sp. UMC71]
MRILHTEAATSYGGQEYSIYKEMVAMRQRGHHLEAVCQPQAELGVRLRSAGFTVHALPMDGLRDFRRAVGGIRRLLRCTPFDVVNTHSRRDTVLAAIAARMAGTSLIVRTRHLAKPINSLYAYTWLAHRVIAVSDFVRRQLLERGVAPQKIGMVYSPVEPPSADEGICVRRELGLSSNALVIGCVAVMREDKGLTDLLDAFERVSAKYPRAQLVLAGDGEPMLSQLRAQAAGLGLAARIHFLGRREDIGNVMTAFDIFALPTRREALGTVFIEAAALGLPVIGGNVGGVPETLLPGVSGILVPPRDAAALAVALDDLLADPERRRAMGAAGRSHVLGTGRFTPAVAATQVESLYLDWLAERGRRVCG